MAVYNKIRKNVASKISSIEDIETFLWDKWLRVPVAEELEIKSIKSKLQSTEDIILNIDRPSHQSIEARISRVKSIKASSRIFSMKSKSHPVFFGFGNARSANVDISFYQELKQYFFSSVLEEKNSVFLFIEDNKKNKVKKQLSPDTRNIPVAFYNGQDAEHFIQSIAFSIKDIEEKNIDISIPLRNTDNVDISIPVRNINTVEYQIDLPDIIDHLSRLKPKVYDVALLNTFDNLNLEGKEFQVKIDLLDSVPETFLRNIAEVEGIRIISPPFSGEIKAPAVKNDYAKEIVLGRQKIMKADITGLQNKNNFIVSLKYDYAVSQNPAAEKHSKHLDIESINKILQPVINLNEDEQEEIFKYLYPYQKEGVEFLSENQRALLIDELGLGKTLQAITAIKYLIRKREIKTALIISNDYFSGNKEFNDKTYSYDGWEGQIRKFAGDITSMVLNSDPANVIKSMGQPVQIFIIPYSVIFKDTHNEIIKSDKFKNIDCICLDDAETVVSSYSKFEKIIKASGSKFLWLLSNSPDEQFQKKMSADFNINSVLSRSKEKVNDQMPSLIRQDFWCELDKKQFTEYDQALFQVKSQIDDVLSTGNPYRLQAKVFTLLHQLKQITNFYSEEKISNKAKLLLRHLESIIKFDSRVVIFSQYDKFGTQKLTELFKQKNVPFISYSPSMSLAEIEKSVKKFKNDKSIKVFLINTQADITNINFSGIEYIIHFDQWWIPTKQWQLEDKITRNNSNQNGVNVISYLTRNTIDEKLYVKLLEKDLLSKNLIDTLGAITFSKLFSENDWLDVFDFPAEKKYKEESLSAYSEKIKSLSPEIVIEKLMQLFSNLGYKSVEKKEIEKKHQYEIKGSFEKEKQKIELIVYCYPTNKKLDQVVIDKISKDAADKLSGKKVLIVTLSQYNYETKSFLPDNLTIMNLSIVSKYFQMLRII